MTMKPNTELNTMMFFDDALESERTYLFTELANVVAQIYAHLLQHPFHDPVGLAVCVELRYMTDALMLGEWFE